MSGKYTSTFNSRPKEDSFIYLKIVTEEDKREENSTVVEKSYDTSCSRTVEYVTTDTLCLTPSELHQKAIFTRHAKEKTLQDEWPGFDASRTSRLEIQSSSNQNEFTPRLSIPKIEGRKAPGANRVLPLITSVWEDNDVHRKRHKIAKTGLQRQNAKAKLSITRKNGQGNFNVLDENEEWLEKWDFDDLGGSIYRAYTDFFMSEEVGESREDCICSECGMEFLTAMHVAHHLEFFHHRGVVKLHQCFVCRRKRYPSLLQLNLHLSEAHGIPRPQLTCRTCFMELVGESEAKAHSRKHQTPYKCPRCPISQPASNSHSISVPRFATQFLLSEHLREIHLPSERPFSCPICGRHFIHEFVRNLHVSKRHTNQSLICPEVRKSLSTSSPPNLTNLNDVSHGISSDIPQKLNVYNSCISVDQGSSSWAVRDDLKTASQSGKEKIFQDDNSDLQVISNPKTVTCSGNMFPDDVTLLRHVFKCHEKDVRVQLLKWAKEVDREDTLFEKLWSSYSSKSKKSIVETVSEVGVELERRISLSFVSPSTQHIEQPMKMVSGSVHASHNTTLEFADVINAPSNQSNSEVNSIKTSSSSTSIDADNHSSQINSKISIDPIPSLGIACIHVNVPTETPVSVLENFSNLSGTITGIQAGNSCLLEPKSHLHTLPKECKDISNAVKSCLIDLVNSVCNVLDEENSVEDLKGVANKSGLQKAISVRCLLCRYLASSSVALERHRRRRHFRNKHCPFCSLACQSVEAVGRHVLLCHLNSSAKDSNHLTPNEGSKESEENAQAQKMVQLSSGLRCPICKKIFSSRGKCNSHQETVHKVEVVSRPLQCNVCSKKFQFQKALERHQLLHGQDTVDDGIQTLYSCPHCEQTFLRPGFLERHIASHFELAAKEGNGKVNAAFGHMCKHCSRRLPTRAKLKAHLRTSHPPSHLRQRFVCSQCPVKCNTASGLRVHMRVHTGERPYNCTKCSMSFKRKTALSKHITAVHTPVPSSDINGFATFLHCSDCSSSFRDRSNLVRHFLQVHRGLRRFVCGVCGAKYAQNQDLRRHLKASHDVDAPKIIGSDRRSADQVYVVPPLAENLPQDDPLVIKICAIVEEEEQKLNEDNLPNFIETSQQLHVHIHKEPVVNDKQVSHSSKGMEMCVSTDNTIMNPKESGFDLIDSVGIVLSKGSLNRQDKSLSIKDDEHGRFVKVDLKSSREINCDTRENMKSTEGKSSSLSQNNLVVGALFSTQISPDAVQLHNISALSEKSLLLNQALNQVESKGLETNPSHANNVAMSDEQLVEDQDLKIEKVILGDTHEKNPPSKNEMKREGSTIKNKKNNPGDFTCCKCGKVFLDATRLERHSKIHIDLKPHTCAVCDKSFVEKYNLKVHMRSHTGERPYKCELCGKSMRYLKEINDHRRMHLGEKPHVCDICSRAFLRLRDLQRHFQTHLNIKKHHCPICNKAFSRLDHLRTVHMKVHEPWRSAASKTSEKSPKPPNADSAGLNLSSEEKCISNKHDSFACEKCTKTFPSKAKLQKHLVLHSGHKAYKCSTCGRSFALASYLSAHQKTHEKQQAYLQCPKCPRRFATQETLSVHEEKFHQRIEKMKKFQSSEQSLNGCKIKDLNLDIVDEERFFMTRTGEFDVNLDLEEEMSIQEVLFEPTSLSEAEKNNTFVYLRVVSDDLQLTNDNSLPG